MDVLLTEANWKRQGLPLRSIKEKLSQTKTGISEALRVAEAADKALRADFLNANLSKQMHKALQALNKTLHDLKASDKNLQVLRDKMLVATATYRANYNEDLRKINRDKLGSLPGALKALQAQAQREFSTGNLAFYDAAVKITGDAIKIIAFMEAVNPDELNLANANKWRTLIEQHKAWKKEVLAQLKVSIAAIVSAQDDTIKRITDGCLMP